MKRQKEENRCHSFIKKEKKEDPGNHRPTSLTLIGWKVIEHIFQKAISKCMEKKVVTVSCHCRSAKGKPWLCSLVPSTKERLSGEGEKKGCFLTLNKVLNITSHKILLVKLMKWIH